MCCYLCCCACQEPAAEPTGEPADPVNPPSLQERLHERSVEFANAEFDAVMKSKDLLYCNNDLCSNLVMHFAPGEARSDKCAHCRDMVSDGHMMAMKSEYDNNYPGLTDMPIMPDITYTKYMQEALSCKNLSKWKIIIGNDKGQRLQCKFNKAGFMCIPGDDSLVVPARFVLLCSDSGYPLTKQLQETMSLSGQEQVDHMARSVSAKIVANATGNHYRNQRIIAKDPYGHQ